VPGDRAGSEERRWKWFLVAWFLLPTVLSFAASYAKPIFLSKYVIVALPPLLLLAAKGLRDLRPRLVQAGIAVVIAALAVTGLVRWYGKETREPWREATAYVIARAEPDDAVILFSARIWSPFRYYLERLGGGEDLQLVYPDGGWGTAVPDNTPPQVGPVTRAAAAHDRVWLVLGYADGNRRSTSEAFATGLTSSFDQEDSRRFRKIRVLLYD
jgi:4-amino-4-deoxy-L-arabinose transferase-like glycosyltransferase